MLEDLLKKDVENNSWFGQAIIGDFFIGDLIPFTPLKAYD